MIEWHPGPELRQRELPRCKMQTKRSDPLHTALRTQQRQLVPSWPPESEQSAGQDFKAVLSMWQSDINFCWSTLRMAGWSPPASSFMRLSLHSPPLQIQLPPWAPRSALSWGSEWRSFAASGPLEGSQGSRVWVSGMSQCFLAFFAVCCGQPLELREGHKISSWASSSDVIIVFETRSC